MTDTHIPALAAIRCPDRAEVDALLLDAVRGLRASGVRVCGHVQRNLPDIVNGCAVLHVEDIATGQTMNITQNLGPGSRGCRLDPSALAEVAGRLMAALDGPVDLVVLNRFGKGEAEGGGLRAVIEKAYAAGVPVLTVVRPGHAAAWDDFTAGAALWLAPDAAEIRNWATAALADLARKRAAA